MAPESHARSEVVRGAYNLIRNQMLLQHGIDRRTPAAQLAAQQAIPTQAPQAPPVAASMSPKAAALAEVWRQNAERMNTPSMTQGTKLAADD